MEIDLIKKLLRLVVSTMRFMLQALGHAARPIATSEESRVDEGVVGTAMNIGVLNYRTERIDNGTDPYGWYD